MTELARSFIDFWCWVSSMAEKDDEMILYRGQSDRAYNLSPSIFRDQAQGKKDAELEAYRSILAEYPEEFHERSHLSVLAKMQHYGTHTQLLDFTTNPLIALYMASEQNPRRDGRGFACKVKKQDLLYHRSDRVMMLACLPLLKEDEQKEIRRFCETHRGVIFEPMVRSSSAFRRFLHEIRGECPAFHCEIRGSTCCRIPSSSPIGKTGG